MTEDAESTREHIRIQLRIQQYAIFRFNFRRRNDMYTTNCIQQKMPKGRANIYVYSITLFPVQFLKMKWYVYHELPGMWCEIKQKQQKVPKARTNINVYSTRCSGFSLILSCWTVSFSYGTVYSRVKRTPESKKKEMSVYLIKRKIKKKMLVCVPGIYPLLF